MSFLRAPPRSHRTHLRLIEAGSEDFMNKRQPAERARVSPQATLAAGMGGLLSDSPSPFSHLWERGWGCGVRCADTLHPS
jgi:hypothetical protein